MRERRSGAGAAIAVVIEECLTGPEVSFFVVSDGDARAADRHRRRDHKRIFDDDRGPNTGGMGAFAPSPLVDAAARGAHHARDRRAGDRRDGRRRAIRFAAFCTSA